MMWEAIGGMALVFIAFMGLVLIYGHYRWEAGYQAHQDDMKQNRADRRAEARQPHGKHHRLTPFPSDTEAFERPLADTGELAVLTAELSAAAESGDFKTIAGSNAAFLRRLDLTRLYGLARQRRERAA